MTDVTWRPSDTDGARMREFARWAETHGAPALPDFRAMHAWSIEQPAAFWAAVAGCFDVLGDGLDGPALTDDAMPGARWFPEASLNYAENVLRWAREPRTVDEIAITRVEEDGAFTGISWRELEARVGSLASELRTMGVAPGDRVVAVLPNVPEAIIGMLAAASVGAVWGICSPDLAPDAIVARLGQLEPKVLIGTGGYPFKGRWCDRSSELERIIAGIPSIEHVIEVVAPTHADAGADEGRLDFAALTASGIEPRYDRVAFEHPLWVLFSSGTTGAPKGIVHGHGGMLLQALTMFGLHQSMGPADTYYVAANTSWMVWNTLMQTMATGAGVICYSGAPSYPAADRQLRIVAEHRATAFATGAAYLALLERSGATPGDELDLGALRTITSTGSPLADSTWRWVHRAVKADVHLGSDSGGTDVCASLIGSNPLEPVRLGRLQGPMLGVDVQAWDEHGERVIGEVGEMVITRPLPSMPVAFWGDADGERYRDAYFDRWPGVWCHGDWITEHVDGTFTVHGRSDATLNRDGVRLGSAEVYSALAEMPQVVDALCIGIDLPEGGYHQPLFVQLAAGVELDEQLREAIAAAIRSHASARHVPDEILAVPAIPLTHAGKRVEVPIKRLFRDPHSGIATDRSSLANPASLDWFVEHAISSLTPAGDR